MALFDPKTIRGITMPNRVVVSPMSQYVAVDGYANDWHFAHLSRFALGGAGIVFTEATAIEARGRRTHGDLGLWTDGHIEPLRRIASFIDAQGAVPGIQLGHAGRKASERRPWHGETPVNEEDVELRGEEPWQAVAPSPLPYGPEWPSPIEMTLQDISDVVTAFRDAAERAVEAGFKVIDVYAGHGFLLHQFYSPIANARTDEYGGDIQGRCRLCVQVAAAIREVIPDSIPLFFRLSATDWVDGGWELEDTLVLTAKLKDAGVDVMDITTGGIGGMQKPRRMPLGEGFQVPYAHAVRERTEVGTMAVGFIWDPDYADRVIENGSADFVALARELLDDPNWTLHAARVLGVDPDFALWKPQFGWWLKKRARVVEKLSLR